MQRREFIRLLGGAMAVGPFTARAQQPAMPVVGFANGQSPSAFAYLISAFKEGLSQNGYVEGQSVAIEYRWAEGQDGRMPALIDELVRRPVDVLGRVDGFDQDEAESKRDERAVILRRLLASKCNTLEALELADRLFDACPRLVECFWKEGGHVFGVGSIRDCRAYSALACGLAI